MAEGHGRDEWGRLSVLLALTANCHRDPKKGRPLKPSDYDPYLSTTGRQAFGDERGEVVEVNRENIGLMKEAFLQQKGVEP